MPTAGLTVAFVDERCDALSPMAAALAGDLGGEEVEALSMGLDPGGRILPGTITALREAGIDTSELVPSPTSRARLETADAVVAIGPVAREAVLSELEARAWDVESPEGGQLAAFRETRDELGVRVRELLRELGVELEEPGLGWE